MAGTSKLTKPFTARVPVELMDWIATLKDEAPAAVLVRALRALKDGTPAPEATGDTAALEAALVRVADLEAENARLLVERNQWRDRADSLSVERNQWRDRAQAIVQAGAAKPVTSHAEGRRLALQHPAGPVYEPKLKVQGTAQPMFRPGSGADKALKGG
jgi:hypothetical protein